MKIKVKFFIQDYYLWIIAGIILIATALTIFLYARGHDWKILISIIGGLFSAIYFIQKQQLDEAKLFKDLFVEFSRRYDTLNEKLNAVIREDNANKDLEVDEINTLYDYFNLCGEEYLFYRKGYIYPEVWRTWVRGMKSFYDNERIQKIWVKELSTGSYYGLDMGKEILKLPHQKGQICPCLI